MIYKSLKRSGNYIGSTSCLIRRGLFNWLSVKPRLRIELGMGSNYFSLLEIYKAVKYIAIIEKKISLARRLDAIMKQT